jgi:hypothetical protein
MSQEAPTVTDVPRQSESELETAETDGAVDTHDEETVVNAGPGASEMGFTIRFGGGFTIGMLAGGVAGVLLNSLALAVFGGFILGTVVGIVLAARG